MARWPRDNQADLIRFYGDPGSRSFYDDNIVKVYPPFTMYYAGKKMPYLAFHKKAAPALKRALQSMWDYCGQDQSVLDREGVSDCAGTYNPRRVRGSKTKWSNHAYASAIDLDAKANGLHQTGDMPPWVIAAFKKEGARWGGDYKGRKDPMHFEFVWNGEDEIAYSADDSMTVAEANTILAAGYGGGTAYAALGDHDEVSAQRRPSFMGRVRNWVVGAASGVGLGGIGYLTDWQVAVALFAFILIVIAIFVAVFFWIFDAKDVRDWIKRQVG